MKKRLYAIAGILFFYYSAAESTPVNTNSLQFNKTLHLMPGQSAACQQALGNTSINVHIIDNFDPNTLTGLAYAFTQSPNDSLFATLFPLGESDRAAFSHYYKPHVPFKIGPITIYVYAVMLNVCNDQLTREVGIAANLDESNDNLCLMTTSRWDACRA